MYGTILKSYLVENSMKSFIVARGWKNAIMRMDFEIELRCVLPEISNKWIRKPTVPKSQI